MSKSGKGQVNAPVQLLLGVTILSFVLVIGFFTYERMVRSQYEEKVKASLSKLARNIELVYQGGQGTSKNVQVDFSPPSGVNLGIGSIRLLPGTEETCKRHTGRQNCLELIVIQSRGPENNDILMVEVMDIPATAKITKQGLSGECDFGGFEYGDWSDQWDSEKIDKCGWLPQSYSVKITKVESGHLKIE